MTANLTQVCEQVAWAIREGLARAVEKASRLRLTAPERKALDEREIRAVFREYGLEQ